MSKTQESDIPPCKFYTYLIVYHSPKSPTPKGRVRDVKEGEPEREREQGEEIVCALHSSETQLLNTEEELTKGLNEGEQLDVMVLDFSNAFDTVEH